MSPVGLLHGRKGRRSTHSKCFGSMVGRFSGFPHADLVPHLVMKTLEPPLAEGLTSYFFRVY